MGYGSNEFNVQSHTAPSLMEGDTKSEVLEAPPRSAAGFAFERQTLKPAFPLDRL
jgi:hypothetical protein